MNNLLNPILENIFVVYLEKEALKKLPEEVYSYKFNEGDSELIVHIKDKNFDLVKVWILLPENYPFEIPQIKMEFKVILVFYKKTLTNSF